MKTIQPRSDCPISFSLDFLGDKWTLIVLRDLLLFGKKTYSEFLACNEKIASNILANRLATLEQYDFVTKQVSPDNKSSYLYIATAKAIDLVPILIEMISFGLKHNTVGDTYQLKPLLKDKAASILYYQSQLKKELKKYTAL
ncbi:transcriptional regulator, HxlR family [Filimonas lacunae]|uniref:Transcriptional regulator, HxlR family n=1 Tax=Filimonas lacunae TaxID=477680 RepID=A0A173MIJ8_9BACT|nr:helix-turn-helix domain-containing protein [Filimonas lacunae]BAV07462.1 transcriptional regulator, HxlR family [Filimonas lacunae]SIT30285.1 transcriptional regulator, HxlR family [Filimonas lacunae]